MTTDNADTSNATASVETPVEINDRIRKSYVEGEKSLLLSGLEMTNQEWMAISKTKSGNYHARFAHFLADFHKKSNGAEFRPYWTDSFPTAYSAEEFNRVWSIIYASKRPLVNNNATVDDDQRIAAKIKSKCWILKGGGNGDSKGDASALWDSLRDAVDTYRDTGNGNAIRVTSNGDSRRRFVDLLFAKDSIERREYCKLASLLADSELLSGEGSPWPELVEVCGRHIQQTPRVDWYLRLDGDCAQYIVGVDNFPKQAGTWQLSIDNDSKRFRTSPCMSFPIPWNRPVPVDFKSASKQWQTTFPEGASCCLEMSETIPFSVFVRHRSASFRDFRRDWWNQQTTPVLSQDKSEFIVCAKKKEVLEKLGLHSGNPELVLADPSPAIDTLWISNPGERVRETQFFGKRFKVDKRPEKDDANLSITSEGDEVLTILVYGKSPFVECEGNGLTAIQTDNPGFLVHKAGDKPLSLVLQNARQGETYSWTARFGETSLALQQGNRCSFIMNPPAGDAIVRFTVNCEDGQGKKVAVVKGCILPAAVYGGLLSNNPATCVGGGWRAVAKSDDSIQDRINGFRQYELTDKKGEELFVRIPIREAELNWWFEEGHNAFSDMNPRPALLAQAPQSSLRQFESAEMENWSLCLPPEVRCPEDWVKNSSSGYWRIHLASLADSSTFIFDPDATLVPYTLPKYGVPLFKYNPQPLKQCLCKSRDGHLGLFVPKTNQATYDIVAYADDDETILAHGKELATTKTGDLFTPIEDRWQSFCSKHAKDGHQAFVIVFEHGEDHRLDFSSVAKKLERRNDAGHFWPKDWTQPTERQLPNPPVYERRVLRAVIDMQECFKSAPDNFPLRRANFLRSTQKQCYEDVKNTWGQTVAAWNGGSAKIEDVAFRIREWEDAGFCPILELDAWIAIRPWLKGTDKIPWMAPTEYGEASDWWGFFHDWTTSDKPLDSKSLEPKSLFWHEAITRAGAKRSKQSIGCLRQLIQQARKCVFQSPDGRTYREWIKVFRRDNNVNNLIGYVLHLEQISKKALPNGIAVGSVDDVEDAAYELSRTDARFAVIGALIDGIRQRQGQRHDVVVSPPSRMLFCLAAIAAMVGMGGNGKHSPFGHDSDKYAAVRNAFSLIRNDIDGSLWNDFCIRELQCERLIETLTASN